jgi:zinc D-Ala-D-Ala carboxypeptidase
MRRTLLLLAATAGLAMAGAAAAQDVCDSSHPGLWGGSAQTNGVSLWQLQWAPFGPTEYGWETYLPLVQRELATPCGPGTPAFAEALARFQDRHDLPMTGRFDGATFQVFRGIWQERRPFIMARVRGEECPEPPSQRDLGYLQLDEEHADRITRLLRYDVLHAYRAMRTAARREVPEIAADPELLQIFSGWRDPQADAARCAAEGNCDGQRRAVCSPHRTGTAVDLYVGHVEWLGVDSTTPTSRQYMSRGPAYRWLVANAHRFGFVPYVFEPWHWEWTGPTAETEAYLHPVD